MDSVSRSPCSSVISNFAHFSSTGIEDIQTLLLILEDPVYLVRRAKTAAWSCNMVGWWKDGSRILPNLSWQNHSSCRGRGEGCPVWLGGKAMKPKLLASSPLPAHSSHPKAAKGHDHCVSAKEEAGHGLRNRGRKQKRKTRPGRLPGLPQAIAKHCRMNHHVLFVSEEH